MANYRIRNWSQFQHYKDRNPAWIKLHFAILSSEDWVMLDDASKLLAVVCMLVASRNDGCVPDNPAYLMRIGYLSKKPDIQPLISCGFLEEVLAHASNVERLKADARPETEERQRREEKSSEAKASGASAPIDFEKLAFERGKQVLGESAGGVIARLKRDKCKTWPATVATIEEAATKQSPMEWVQGVLRKADPDEEIYRNVL